MAARQLPLLLAPEGVRQEAANGWTWSVSAHHEFRTCQRRYFFSRIAANHRSHTALRRAAYERKRLQSVPAWRGSLLHQVLGQHAIAIARDERGALDRAQEVVRQRAMAQFEFSREGQYRTQVKARAGANYAALQAHEDNQALDGEPKATVEVVTQSIANLVRLEELKRYLRFGDVRIEDMLRVKHGPVAIVGRADAIAVGAQVVIVDWKLSPTGSINARRQLETYGWVLAHRERLAILLVEANLARGETEEWLLTDRRREAAGDFVLQSIEEIQALFGNHRFDEEMLVDLDYAKSQGSCALCPYRELCGKTR